MDQALMAVVVALVGSSAFGSLTSWLIRRMDRTPVTTEDLAPLRDGLKVLLRGRLETIYRECGDGARPLTVEQKKDADEAYDAYHSLGGNGLGTEMHERIIHAPTRTS